ncbi:hypothetical protein FOA43_003605 [Brettanomyces nanus]|uniref:Allantoate permease n=1 Tax=Eeniella nana TaxID=13502 RepID=A0A875S991_EENNA|nr:uncharacterized protein FOA43_003605 [Brettanomyces nanus]QPG76219.1 hypothetical protein FOA43_003605 [Brettanomyces nanus]
MSDKSEEAVKSSAVESVHPLTSFISPVSGEVIVDFEYSGDRALKYVQNLEVISDVTESEYNKLKRKIDWYILPLISLIFGTQYIDKSTLSFAAVMGLKTDIPMHGQQYSWLTTAFYLSFLVFVFPISRCLQKYPLIKTTSICIIAWGIVLCCHAACHSYGTLLLCRILLGGLESAVTPAFVLLSSKWYKQEESFLRTTVYYSNNGFGTIIGCAIAYGCFIHTTGYAIGSWRVLFIVTGLMTMVLGGILYFHIPDNPPDAWFLKKREKSLVLQRIKDSKQGYGSPKWKWYQFKESMKDPRTWLGFFYAFSSNIPNGGLGSFMSILLSDSLGYGPKKSLLMRMPGGAVETVGLIAFALFVGWFPQRIFISSFITVVVIAGSCMLAFCSNTGAQLAGLYLYSLSPIGMICFLSLFSANTLGYSKKITSQAILLIGYCVGNLVGPQTFVTSEAPKYHSAKVAIVVCYVFSLFCLIALFFVNYYDNKRRDKLESDPSYAEPHIENIEFADLTDREVPAFRYLY